MSKLITILMRSLLDGFRSRQALQLEILVLRHQLGVYQRTVSRPRLQGEDRVFWSLISRHWSGWRETLVLVRPETVLRWRRRRFRDHWTRLSRSGRTGRPSVPTETRRLIRHMSRTNPLWGVRRLRDELSALGIEVSAATVAKYRVVSRKPPSPSWRAFLKAHLTDAVAVDFFTVPTARNRVLYVFLVLSLKRRHVVHFNVAEHPTARWTAQQITEAFPWDTAPRHLMRDRDQIFGAVFEDRLDNLGIEQLLSAPRSPWQNAYVERVIGSIRRECVDHVIVLSERHLKRVLQRYFSYYHQWRPHQGLAGETPTGRRVQDPDEGRVIEVDEVFGLHHHYERRAA